MRLDPESEQRLSHIGWRPGTLHDNGLTDTAPDNVFPARVIEQHRVGYRLHDGREAFNAQPAPRFLKAVFDPVERPAVGDFVLVVPGTPAQIERVLPRRSMFSRAAAGETHRRQIIATNIDTVFVLTGLDGDFNPARIERYLVLVASSGARPVIVLTKTDIAADAETAIASLRERIAATIDVIAINSKSPESVAPLLAWLQPGDTAVLAGSSGVGKSTLTNTLLGESRQSTAAVRAHDSRGRHTTTHRALIALPSGGCLIDTPGMRELKLTGDESVDSEQYNDIEALSEHCRFGDCGHVSEPGCAVRAALEAGTLDSDRFEHYLKLRDEIDAAAESLEARLRRKGETKMLTKALGKRLHEKYGERS
ncbi:MAG: ribosome small subunit-dependent GTPase A [Dokdonella sp.]